MHKNKNVFISMESQRELWNVSKLAVEKAAGNTPIGSGPKHRKPLGQRVKEFFIDYRRQWEIQSMIIPGIIFMIIFVTFRFTV